MYRNCMYRNGKVYIEKEYSIKYIATENTVPIALYSLKSSTSVFFRSGFCNKV